MKIAEFLIAMVGPMFSRLLASAGVSLITITGLTAALAALKDQVTASVNSLPLMVLQLGGLMGIWEALGIVFGTFTFLATWKGTSGFISLAKKR